MIPAEFLAFVEARAAALTVYLPLLAAVATRLSVIAFLAPGLGEPMTPMRVRLAAVAAFSMIVAPPLAAAGPIAVDGAAALATLIVAEALIGLVIGFTLRLAVFILQIVGSIAAQHLSMSQLFGPGVGHDQETPLSGVLMMAGIAAACASGLHIEIAAMLVKSYAAFPVGVFPAAAEAGDFAARQSGAAIAIAFGLAAPFVILGFVYTVALAAMSRAMPQLAATFVGAPAILFAGLALFAASSSLIILQWTELLAAIVADPVGDLR